MNQALPCNRRLVNMDSCFFILAAQYDEVPGGCRLGFVTVQNGAVKLVRHHPLLEYIHKCAATIIFRFKISNSIVEAPLGAVTWARECQIAGL